MQEVKQPHTPSTSAVPSAVDNHMPRMLHHDSEPAPPQLAITMHDVVDDSVSDLMESSSLQGDVKAQREGPIDRGQRKRAEGDAREGRVPISGHVRLPPHMRGIVSVISALPPRALATTTKAARRRGCILSGSDLVRDGGREECDCCGL